MVSKGTQSQSSKAAAALRHQHAATPQVVWEGRAPARRTVNGMLDCAFRCLAPLCRFLPRDKGACAEWGPAGETTSGIKVRCSDAPELSAGCSLVRAST
jgi:hypothetical protein